MINFVINRLWQSIILVFIVTVLTFFLINLAPGGPSSLMRMDATAEEREALIERMGLDKPVIIRYGEWLGDTIQGDFGVSLTSGQPVIQRVAERFPHTLELAAYTLIFSIVVGVILGIISAIRRNSVSDYSINFFSAIGLSIPSFWLAIMLIYLFSVVLQWLPSSGVGSGNIIERFKYLLMPVLILSTTTLPTIVRFTRSSMLEVISQNYVRTARAKGAKELAVIYWHALRNALIPVVTIIGVLIPRLLGGAVITETVFGWPGMGRLIVEAAQGRDYNLVMGVTVIVTIIVILSNFIVDIIYSRIDPRVKNM
ncbi:ABC transporter permease [Bacillus mycoides]|uniref:ABC transporter permease n=1 Tax=Bacillus mycoides TaxID=1405 RepID=UPI000BFE568D|nr:ABC transporter permease [Bacillus mycoides]MCQ6530421.1 ABC transporter permease [Bacillus mycoides]PGT56883.1 diguanylate cyclase [Bacillus cereus]PGV94126.1 diguanylate cyclase [Bacillus cereus]